MGHRASVRQTTETPNDVCTRGTAGGDEHYLRPVRENRHSFRQDAYLTANPCSPSVREILRDSPTRKGVFRLSFVASV